MQRNLADYLTIRLTLLLHVSDLQGHDSCEHGNGSLLIILTRQPQMLAGWLHVVMTPVMACHTNKAATRFCTKMLSDD